LADFGEGEYEAKESAIRGLLAEAGAAGLGGVTHPHAVKPSEAQVTPESYLGAARAERFANGEIAPGTHDYGPLGPPPAESELRYSGNWNITSSSATPLSGAKLQLDFVARRVYLVMGSTHAPLPVKVLLDGTPIPASLAGADVRHAHAQVGFQRLYRIVELPAVERHVLTIEPAAGLSLYSFTFG
jgi:hypothetical protein